jgi:hypothetical protein
MKLVATLVVLAFALPLAFASGALGAGTGSIAGRVTDFSTTAAIEGIEVCASAESNTSFEFGCATTDSQGEYSISGLGSGEYTVEFTAPAESGLNYITQYYNGRSSYSEASAVSVTSGSIASGIDAALKEGGLIAGKVTDVSTKAAIAGVEVCASAASIESGGCARTKPNGEYTVAGLASGEYTVEFAARSPFEGGLNYITQFYNGRSLASEANKVPVIAGSTASGIDAELKEGGQIAGRVTDASTGAALEGALACVPEAGGGISLGRCAITNASGDYTLSGLASGENKVEFNDGRKYVAQYYNDKSTLAEANTVSVVTGSTVAGIDAAMQPTPPKAGPPVAPVDTTPPAVSGTPAVGSAVACANGLWSGNPAPTFTYRWLRDGTPIPGATASGYRVQSADEGHGLSCEVTAKNASGEKSATSAALAIPGGSLPPPTKGPAPLVTIAGSKIVVSRGSVRIHVKCAEATCRGSIELTVRIVVKRHRRGSRTVSRRETVVLAKGTFSIADGKGATVVLRLTATGRTRLAHAKRHPIAAKLIVSVKGGKTTTKPVLVG